jgi:hypothetical protein
MTVDAHTLKAADDVVVSAEKFLFIFYYQIKIFHRLKLLSIQKWTVFSILSSNQNQFMSVNFMSMKIL